MVINASTLITLFRSGQADLLPRLFNHIVVPDAVWQEVVLDEWEDTAALDLGKQPWPVHEAVVSSPRVAAWALGAGHGRGACISQAARFVGLRHRWT